MTRWSSLARSFQRSDSILLWLISWNVLPLSSSVCWSSESCLATLNAQRKLWMTPSGGSLGKSPRVSSRSSSSRVWVHAVSVAARFPEFLRGRRISGVTTRGDRPMLASASAFLSCLPDWTVGTMTILFTTSSPSASKWLMSFVRRGWSQFRKVISCMCV